MRLFLIGLLLAISIFIVIPLIVIAFGGVNMAASGGPGTLEAVLANWTVNRSVAVRTGRKKSARERRGRHRRRPASLPRNVRPMPRRPRR